MKVKTQRIKKRKFTGYSFLLKKTTLNYTKYLFCIIACVFNIAALLCLYTANQY